MSTPAKGRNARERLTDAARKLFACKGFHSSSMSELATAAGVSVGQVYRLFESKDDIIVAIVRSDFEVRGTAFESLCARVEAGEIDPETGFAEFARLSTDSEDEGLSFEILAEAYRNPRVSDGIAEFCSDFRAIIRRLVCTAQPAFGPLQLDASEELFLACLFGLSHRTLSRPTLPPDQIARFTGRMLIGALAALA